MRASYVTGILVLATASTAIAATPENGTVSKDSHSVKWEGTATGYGVFPTNLLLDAAGQEPAPCEAPYCDTFALKVADKADLNLFAAQRAADNFTEIHVITPGGEKLFAQSGEAEPVRVKIKNAAPGDYTVEVMTNESAEQSGEYDASATLAVPPPPAPAPSQGQPAPAPAPAPGQPAPAPGQPAPADAPAATLGLATNSVSAKKKKFKLALTSTKPVTGVQFVLAKGKKVVAKGALKSLNGKASVVVKLKKKLKPGTYRFAVTASDGGRKVGLTTELKVKK